MARREKELRCFCRGEPLLGTYGVDSRGVLFVHVKIYKQSRIYGELIFQGGIVKLRCRNCLRWHRVIFRQTDAQLAEDSVATSSANVSVSPVLDGGDDS